MLSYVIECALGSLLAGIAISLSSVFILLFSIKNLYPAKSLSNVGLIAGGILCVLLMFELIPMCGAVGLKWKCNDIGRQLEAVSDMPEPASGIGDVLGQLPVIGSLMPEDVAGVNTLEACRDKITQFNSYLNSVIVRSVIWSLVFMSVAAVVIIKTLAKPRGARVRGTGRSRGLPSRGVAPTSRHVRGF